MQTRLSLTGSRVWRLLAFIRYAQGNTMNGPSWYYMVAEEPEGPVPWSRIVDLWRAGYIKSESLVRSEESNDWLTFADTKGTVLSGPTSAASVAQEEAPEITDARGWSADDIAPWRRYGARMLDITVNGILGALVLGVAWFMIAPISAERFFVFLETQQSGTFVETMIAFVVAGVVGGVIVGATGTSVGKGVFGIRVVDLEGNTIGILNGWKREAIVWVVGLGFGIPLVNLLAMIAAHRRLLSTGTTIWDNGRYRVFYRPRGNFQTAMNAIGVALIVLIVVASRLA
jgi:uncharacterized RDD family membrane protein YckC